DYTIATVARLVQRVDDHQYAQDGPEEHILRHQQARAPQPEPLIGMQEPGHREDEQCRQDERPGVPETAELEVGGVIEDLQHEVLPVDVDPPPEFGEARSKQVEVMCLRQAKTEEVEDANHEVELP